MGLSSAASSPGPRAGAGGALAAACGSRPDFELHGVPVVVDSQTPFATHPDLPGRLESTIDAALGYWGGSWSDLERVTISLEDARYVECLGPCVRHRLLRRP